MQLLPEDASLESFELDGIPVFSQDDEQNPPAIVCSSEMLVLAQPFIGSPPLDWLIAAYAIGLAVFVTIFSIELRRLA